MAKLPAQDLEHILEHTRDLWGPLAGTRFFITGGTGFVGKWLLESLLWVSGRLNLRISAVVLTRDAQRFRSDYPHLGDDARVELSSGELSAFTFPSGDFPFVIHAATVPNFDLDLKGTRRVLEFARTHGTRCLLFTSSGAVYGRQPPDLTHIPEDYAGAPLTADPGSEYGHAKRASEFLCTVYGRQYGFAALIARLFAFIGPHLPLDRNFAVGNFIGDVIADEPIHIKGDGTPYRSYLYAADLAVWLWTILVRGEPAHPYNVGSDQAVTIAELARTVASVAGKNTRIEIAGKPVPGAPALRYVPSVERARRELDLRPIVALEEGVRRTYDWTQSEFGAGTGMGFRAV